MRELTYSQFRRSMRQHLQRASNGETTLVTRHGVAYAYVLPKELVEAPVVQVAMERYQHRQRRLRKMSQDYASAFDGSDQSDWGAGVLAGRA